jgi:hypothetical protein
MATELDLEYEFPTDPDTLYGLYSDPEFVRERLSIVEATSKEVTSHDVGEGTLQMVVTIAMARSVLPKPVRGFVRGEPELVREENWHKTADGYGGDSVLTLKGPGTIKGTMSMQRGGAGTVVKAHFDISMPIPMFGAEVEKTLATQITDTLDAESKFTVEYLKEKG